ncbi:MAG: hypothetical protein JXB07_10140 [Anaerolineae bacterium]|nr:hypothetical protein [Anaerolineae bacterium]
MSEISTQLLSVNMNNLKRQAVRSWWADGLWDFAMGIFFGLLAVWSYYLMRVMSFPSWTWPWPFITNEPINPMQNEITLWIIGGVIVLAGYTCGAYCAVQALRSYWLAPIQGEVHHPFGLSLEKRVWIIYLVTFVAITGLYSYLNMLLLGQMRYFSATFAAAPAGMLFTVGLTYRIRRYQWVAVSGLAISIGLEWFVTTPSDYMQGPQHFLDVPGIPGNPAIPLLVWFALCLVSGIIALHRTLRSSHVKQD